MLYKNINENLNEVSSKAFAQLFEEIIKDSFVNASERICDSLFFFELGFLHDNKRDKESIEAFLSANKALAKRIEELLSSCHHQLIKDFKDILK